MTSLTDSLLTLSTPAAFQCPNCTQNKLPRTTKISPEVVDIYYDMMNTYEKVWMEKVDSSLRLEYSGANVLIQLMQTMCIPCFSNFFKYSIVSISYLRLYPLCLEWKSLKMEQYGTRVLINDESMRYLEKQFSHFQAAIKYK